jgi:hypothetical protein
VALCPGRGFPCWHQLDRRNLLWRSVIRYGTGKIWHWPLLMILAVARLQILDDVSNLIQTRMRDRLRLTATGRLITIPRLERLRTPIDRLWLAFLTSVMYAYAYRAPYCGALSYSGRQGKGCEVATRSNRRGVAMAIALGGKRFSALILHPCLCFTSGTPT